MNPSGLESHKLMRETHVRGEIMFCSGLSTGIHAQTRGGKDLETSCVEVILSIHGRNARDSWDRFGNCTAIFEKTLVIKMESELSYFNKLLLFSLTKKAMCFCFLSSWFLSNSSGKVFFLLLFSFFFLYKLVCRSEIFTQEEMSHKASKNLLRWKLVTEN